LRILFLRHLNISEKKENFFSIHFSSVVSIVFYVAVRYLFLVFYKRFTQKN